MLAVRAAHHDILFPAPRWRLDHVPTSPGDGFGAKSTVKVD
jgi:hypothetical protein